MLKPRYSLIDILMVIGGAGIFLLLVYLSYEVTFPILILWVLWVMFVILLTSIGPYVFLDKEISLSTKEELYFKYKIRVGIVTAFGGVAIFAGVLLQWKNYNLDQQKTEIQLMALKQQGLEVDSRDNERFFNEGVAELGSKNLMVRVGGISALIQLAHGDPNRYYWPVVRELNAYLKEYTPADFLHPHTTKPKPDIAIILSFYKEGYPILPRNSSEGFNLSGLDLSYAHLFQSNFDYVDFSHSVLNYVDFGNSKLVGANFTGASLKYAKLSMADFDDAKFIDANLEKTILDNTNFAGVQFAGARFLVTDFNSIIGVNFYNADFCSIFDWRSLSLVEKCATGLSCSMIRIAKTSSQTKLPPLLKCNS